MSRKWFGRLSVLGAIGVLAIIPARADIIGDVVHVNYLYPQTNTVYINFPDALVTASGAPFDIFGHDTFTVFPSVITMTNDDNLDHLFVSADFNGFSVDDVTSPGRIIGVTIDPLTNLAGFDPSRVFFIGATLFVNFQDLTSLPTTYVQLDLTTTATTPEPTSLTLVVTALVGIALGLWRNKQA